MSRAKVVGYCKVLVSWLQGILGCRSPSKEFVRVFSPIAEREMLAYLGYLSAIISMPEKDTNVTSEDC